MHSRSRGLRLLALALGVALVAGACAGGERPSLGEAAAATPERVVRRDLDPASTYVATAAGPVDVFATADADEPERQVTPPVGADASISDGFVLVAPYEVEPGRHEVYLPEGGTAWLRDQDVTLAATNVVAVARGTEVDPSGAGGGEVAVYAEPDAPEPAQLIGNPKSAEGLNVGPVVFLTAGPYDPQADWMKVYLPVRPNGSTGFVRAGDVDVSTNRFRVEVELSTHKFRLFDGDQPVLETDIGVGTDNTPTPGGVFYIRSLIASTDPVYGTYAFGLSGFSEVYESFNGGPGDIGIHGTNDPSTIGTDVSNGCIRLPDETVIHLAQVLPEASGAQSDQPQISTGLGVPVEVLA
jgi:lipoprotein-anchoring transpeptidase ErfK/SrfK